ncbi:N-acetylneuraminate synthase family protein [Solibacillus cecembensis]|uniref:N-acetylneuraminate synthase family protein n=1 Tax=Solibacillus cecembensis TaxID=459347 RepID=UPI003D023A81
MKIGNYKINSQHPTFIVAEIGANHNNDLGLIKKTIDAAAECGVNAVKFQTYTSKELLSDYERLITYGDKNQITEPIGEMFDKLSLKREWHEEIFEYANSRGLVAFSTPFSIDGASFLNDLEVPCFKIAASDVNFLKMLEYVGSLNKPVMLSLGKCTIAEADEAITTLEKAGCSELVIMHCVAQYPSPMEDMNLRIIETLKLQYPDKVIGFSDHTTGVTAAIGAVVLGARVIEKHFTLDKKLEGPDHWFSMDPSEMKALVSAIRDIELALGSSRKMVAKSEVKERETSIRSIVLKNNLKCGDKIAESDLKFTRPGWGIAPSDLEKIVGLAVNQDLERHTVLEWKYFK